MAPQTKKPVVDKVFEGLMANVKHDETAKQLLTDEQLVTEIYQNFDSAATKSGMLKLLRAMDYKVAQSRCYAAYGQVAAALKPIEKK